MTHMDGGKTSERERERERNRERETGLEWRGEGRGNVGSVELYLPPIHLCVSGCSSIQKSCQCMVNIYIYIYM